MGMMPGMGILAGNLIGSYLLGQQQRQAQMEERDQKMQLMKMQMQAAKLKADREKRTDAWLQKLIGPELEPQEPQDGGVQYGESFGPKKNPRESRLMDILFDPIKAAALKEATGVDFIGAGNLYLRQQTEARQWEEFAARERERLNDIRFKLQETHPGVQVEGEGGRKSIIYPRKYNFDVPPQLGGGMGPPPQLGGQRPAMPSPGGIPTMPGVEQQPLASSEKDNWIKINPDNGTIVRPDYSKLTTPKQLADNGFVYASKEAQAAIGDFAAVDNILSKITGLMEASIPKEESSLERIPGAISRKAQATLQTSPELAQLEKLLTGTLGPMIRTLGEKGALAEGDVKRALDLMPQITDRGPVAWGALNNVVDIIQGAKKARLGGLANDSKQTTPPAAALKQLKPGIRTRFGNGQVWTLQNGQPVRIE